MASSFAHFDASHTENFCSALLLLALEEDERFRAAFVRLVRKHAQAIEQSPLVGCGREDGLRTSDDSLRRSDIWLEFVDGTILLEVKTHSGWSSERVAKQLRDQLTSARRGQPVRGALLLAPSGLLRRVQWPGISWQELLDRVKGIEHRTRVLDLAYEHWSEQVEREFGFDHAFAAQTFNSASMQTACLVVFLRNIIIRLGGKPRGQDVWFSTPNGCYRTRNGWTWFGVAVPGRIEPFGHVHVGIYNYTKVPPNEQPGTFLELYRDSDEDNAVKSVLFNPPNLTNESLEAALAAFVEELRRQSSVVD